MGKLKTFIGTEFRPEIKGSKLEKEHKTYFKLSNKKYTREVKYINAICFGPKKDNVLINLEHAISGVDGIVILYYEDIHIGWTYIQSNSDMYVIYKNGDDDEYILRPKNIYIRSCYVDEEDRYWTILGEFFNFIDSWNGTVLCSPKQQTTNESKLFQLNNSLIRASKRFSHISIGESYVIKGMQSFEKLNKEKSYIVKSMSGIRSIVVDNEEYDKWNKKNMNSIPTLFQEKIEGCDLRVHIVNKKTFGKQSLFKEKIDYRYDKNFFNMTSLSQIDEELHEFCVDVSKYENNKLLGLDFVKNNRGYVVLEANPSPGWSAYHNCNGIEADEFVTELLQVLKSA